MKHKRVINLNYDLGEWWTGPVLIFERLNSQTGVITPRWYKATNGAMKRLQRMIDKIKEQGENETPV